MHRPPVVLLWPDQHYHGALPVRYPPIRRNPSRAVLMPPPAPDQPQQPADWVTAVARAIASNAPAAQVPAAQQGGASNGG